LLSKTFRQSMLMPLLLPPLLPPLLLPLLLLLMLMLLLQLLTDHLPSQKMPPRRTASLPREQGLMWSHAYVFFVHACVRVCLCD
jgi:hypothetical protein